MEYNWFEINMRLQSVLDRTVSRGEECACQLVVYDRGRKVVDLTSGTGIAPERQKITSKSLFPVFSCGKAVLSLAVLQAIEKGRFTLSTPAADIWPGFAAGGKEGITVEHILSHRAGLHLLPKLNSTDELADWDGMCRKLAAMTPRYRPGSKSTYHPLTFAWLAGNLLILTEKKPLQDILNEWILRPCGIEEDFCFGTDDLLDRRFVRLDDSAMPQQPSWYTQMIGNPLLRHSCIPSFNSCANAGGMARFYAALAGMLPGVRLLEKSTLLEATAKLWRDPDDVVPEDSWAHFGLGFILCGPPHERSRMFGHGGAAGAEAFYDRETGLAVAFTKNRPVPVHPIHPIRDEISEILGLPARHW